MEEPLNPRQFLRKFHLPQLVCIHESHKQKLNTIMVDHGGSKSGQSAGSRSDSSGIESPTSSAERRRSSSKSRSSPTATSSSNQTSSSTSSRSTSKCDNYDQNEAEDDEKAEASRVSGIPQLDLDQPFLLYKAYQCRQVIGHILDYDGAGGLRIDGPALLIPENFPGWFSLVTTTGRTAGYYESMEQIAAARVPYFLSKDEMVGYVIPKMKGRIFGEPVSSSADYASNIGFPSITSSLSVSQNNTSPSSGSASAFHQVYIRAGQVLRFLAVYEDVSSILTQQVQRRRSRSSSLGRSASRPRIIGHGFGQGTKYAKCVRYSIYGGDIVFIPLTHTGRYYVIGKKTSSSYNYVYPMAQILRIAKFPATVQLIVGPKPKNFHPTSGLVKINPSESPEHETFSAIIRLQEIRTRDVILACTLRPKPFASVPKLPTRVDERKGPLAGRSRRRDKKRGTYATITASVRRSLSKLRLIGDVDNEEDEDEPVLLEFDLDSSFSFVRTFIDPKNHTGTLGGRKIPELVFKRLSYCNQEAELWRRQIKIAHDVVPKPQTIPVPGGAKTPQLRRGHSLMRRSPYKQMKAKSMTSIEKTSVCREPSLNRDSLEQHETGGFKISRIFSKIWHPEAHAAAAASGPTSLPAMSTRAKSMSNGHVADDEDSGVERDDHRVYADPQIIQGRSRPPNQPPALPNRPSHHRTAALRDFDNDEEDHIYETLKNTVIVRPALRRSVKSSGRHHSMNHDQNQWTTSSRSRSTARRSQSTDQLTDQSEDGGGQCSSSSTQTLDIILSKDGVHLDSMQLTLDPNGYLVKSRSQYLETHA